ncbi:M61 family metallopeptidase [soil metagenome]
MLNYQVTVHPHRQCLEVSLDLEASGSVTLATPMWVPGAYGFLKYARDIVDLRAEDAATGAALVVTREGWQGFRIDGATGRVRVRYLAHAADPALGEVAGHVHDRWALLLGTRYLRPVGYDGPCLVEYVAPEGWKLHHPSGAERKGPMAFLYARYQDVLDTPVVLGSTLNLIERDVRGTPFYYLFLDDALGFELEAPRFLDALDRCAGACTDALGPFPFTDYTFVFTHDPRLQWGLEHATSTTIGLGPSVYIDPDAHLDAIRVSIHELVHTWIVKRLRPKKMASPDLDNGTFVDGLWLAEGFTRYYEFLLAARAGQMSSDRFFSNVGNYFSHLTAMGAYGRTTPRDSSLATFLNHGRYPGMAATTIDYYDAGMLVAFDLDVVARRHGLSLDGIFRDFYAAHLASGFDSDDVKRFFREKHADLGTLLDAEIDTPGALSTPARLEELGFELEKFEKRELGLVIRDGEITSVLDRHPAARAGLAIGDRIERVEGFPFSPHAIQWARDAIDHGPVTLHVARGHRVHTCTVQPSARAELGGLVFRGDEAKRAKITAWLGTEGPAIGARNSLRYYDNFHGRVEVI